MSYGAQVKFAIARQASTGSGTAVTAAGSFHHIPFTTEDVGLSKEEVISQNLTGRFEQGAIYDGVSRVDGSFECEPEPWSLAAILMAGVNNATAVTSGSLKTFTFFPRTQDYSSLFCNEPISIYKQFSDSNSAELYFDSQVGQVEFSITQGQLAIARATVVGGARVLTGIGSLGINLHTADAQRLWLWDVASISYNGSALSQATEMTVTLNENIEALYSLNGTLSPYKYARSGFREVSVSGTMYFTERDVLNDFVAGTQRRLTVAMRNTRYQIQSGYYPTFEIDVPQLKITQFKPSATGPGEVAVSFTGRGVTDANSNYAVKFTLINTFANTTL